MRRHTLGHVSFISIETYVVARSPTRHKALLTIRRTLFGMFIWLIFILYAVFSVVEIDSNCISCLNNGNLLHGNFL